MFEITHKYIEYFQNGMIERNINELLPLSQLIFIIAESGYGKSSLVKTLLNNFKSGFLLIIFCFCCFCFTNIIYF
jgi:ABC-type ATPase involved in cell division